jgi:hypothetical protein
VIGIVLLVALLCAGLVVAAAVIVLLVAPAGQVVRPSTAAPTPAQPTAAPPASPPMTGTPPTPTASPAVVLDEATLAMLSEIEQQVVELRGLEPNGAFDLQVPTYEEYKQITIEDFAEDYSPEEAADDGRVLTALGLLPEGFDLYQLYLDLYSENILGSYNQETRTMYVLQAGGAGRLGGVERQTYAHEYQHALQDQNYGLEALGLSDEGCEKDTERCSAIRALVEGDATLLDTQWLDRFGTSDDIADIADFYRDFSSPSYDRAPCYLRDDFYWPYDYGLQFVQGLYDAGRWQAVDAAYQNPPVSSEQIMHPGLYHSGDVPEVIPSPVLTDTLGVGWRQIDANVMGEWYTYLILVEPFRDSDPASAGYCSVESRATGQMGEAAAGWGGDAYAVHYNADTNQIVLVMLTIWDSSAEADEFADGFGDYSDARFGSTAEDRGDGQCWDAGDYGVSCFFQKDTDTLWVMAPDTGVADQVLEAIPW